MPATVVAHWIGDSGNWSDPTHWDIGVVPNNSGPTTYEVVIDLPASNPIITINGDVTIGSIQSTEALVIQSGTLLLNSGMSGIHGSLSMGNATLRVAGNGTALLADGATQVENASLFASGGATFSLPSLISFIHDTTAAGQGAILQAEGAGSVLDLSNVTSLTSSSAIFSSVNILAIGGGKVDLSHLAQVTAGYVVFGASNPGSLLDLSALTTWNGTGQLQASDATVLLNAGLTSLDSVAVTIEGTATMNISTLTRLSHGSLTLIGTSRTLPNLTDIATSSFYAKAGATLSLPSVTSFNHNTTAAGQGSALQAEGLGSVLDLSSITSLTSSNAIFSSVNIVATGGGKVDLSHLTQVTAGYVVFGAYNPGSLLDLSALTAWDGTGQLQASNATVLLNAGLTSLDSVAVTIEGTAVMNLNALTRLTHGSLTLIGASRILPNLTDIATSSFYAKAGATLSLPSVTSFALDPVAVAQGNTFQAEGAGSVLDLSNLTSFASSSALFSGVGVLATGGGKVDLSGLTQVTAGYVTFGADGPGSLIDLSLLASLQTSGAVLEEANSGRIAYDQLRSFANTTFKFATTDPFVLPIGRNWSGSGSIQGSVVVQGQLGADRTGETLAITGSLSADGILRVGNRGTMDVDGSVVFGSEGSFSLTQGSVLRVAGDLRGELRASLLADPKGSVIFDGAGTAASPQLFEVMSADLGLTAAAFSRNFVLGSLALANNTRVNLIDSSDNSTGGGVEALYVNSLVVPAGTTLDLNGLHVYARALQIDGTVVGGTVAQFADSGPLNAAAPTPGTIGVSGELDEWTFFGRAGRSVSVAVNPGSSGSSPALSPQVGLVKVRLLDASGSVIAEQTTASDGALTLLQDIALPADGTYRIQVLAAPSQPANTGNYAVAFYDVTHQSSALTLGQPVSDSIATPFAVRQWTFSAAPNDQIRFDLRAVSGPGIVFDLTGPAGAIFTGLTADSDLISLSGAGTYTLTARGVAEETGAFSFSLDPTSVTDLALGGTVNGTLVGNGQAKLYRIEVPTGQPLRITLDDSSATNHNEIYVQRGSAPTRGTFDFSATTANSPDQGLLIPLAAPGTWFVLVYGDFVPGNSTYTLTAEGSPLIVQNVTPDRHGNSTATTVTLTGAGFDRTTALTLISSTNAAVLPTSFTVDSPTRITATFAAGLAVGTYTVRVTEPGITKDLAEPFTVVAGGQAKLETNLVLPQVFGRRAPATIFVEYANTGDIAMDAPLLTLYGTDNARLTLDQTRLIEGIWTVANPEGFSDVIQILASGEVPGFLQPGESIRVPVYFAGIEPPFNGADNRIGFDLKVLTADDTTPIAWDAFKDTMRPASLTTQQWEPVWQNFIASSGDTLGEYVAMLDSNASYLGRLGQRVLDVSSLIGFEYLQADGLSPLQNLATAVDVSLDAPGLDLVFSRVFQAGIADRNDTGDFGHGWSHNWDVQLVKSADGTVTITGTGGSTRVFQPDSRSATGAYFAQDGDHGDLTPVTGGGYQLVEPDGLTKRFDANGKLLFLEDTNGNRITTFYTGDRLASLTHSSGRSLTFAWNAAGHIASVADSLGRATTFGYDAAGTHLTSVTDLHGQVTTYSYATGPGVAREHSLTTIAYPGGTHQFFTYDNAGRLAGLSRDDGPDADTLGDEALAFAYDSAGRVSVTDALSATTDFFFDHRGLLLKTRDPLGNSVLSAFDHEFNLTAITDAAGQNTTFRYDAEGNLVRTTDALGGSTSFTYTGGFNRLASFTDANGNVTRYGYDADGNLLTTTNAAGSVERATYDPLGQLDVLTNHRGQPIDYDYNAAGQLTRKTFADGTHTDYAYDADDRLASTTDASGTTTFTYDAAGRLDRVTYPNGRFLDFDYDAGGRRTQSVDQDGFKVTYQYDAVGRLTGLKDGSGANIVSYTYDPAGQLTRKDNGNGTYTTYDYDDAGQLLSLVNRAPDNTVQSSFVYTYNVKGQRTSMETMDGEWTYSYDATGQLTRAVFDSTNGAITDLDLTYVYDAAGNRIRTVENGLTTNYTTNGLNQYTQVGSAVLTYDADGNLIRKVNGTNISTYSYDAENRLSAVVTPAGTWTYQYDSLGNRIATLRDGLRTDYLIDPVGLSMITAEYSMGGAVLNHYTYGLGLTSRVAPSGESSFFLFDGTGNSAGFTSGTGSLAVTYRFDPFGSLLTSGVPDIFGFGAMSAVSSDASGLVSMRARFYDPGLGRFTSIDPIGLIGGDVNLLRYVGNDPVNFSDPSGLFKNPFAGPYQGYADYAEKGGNATAEDDAQVQKDYQKQQDQMNGLKDAVTVLGTPTSPETAISSGLGSFFDNLFGGGNGSGREGGGGDGNTEGGDGGRNGGGRFGRGNGGDGGPDGGMNGGSGDGGLQGGIDPNALTGPAGYGPLGYLSVASVLPYRIDFENDAAAQVPAQHVRITHQLDSDLDWSTFALTEIGFGDELIAIPDGSRHFQTTVGFTYGGESFDVLIEAGVNAETGLVFATFQSIDPATSLPPSVLTGFLPPEDGTGRGMGHVSYAIKAKTDRPTGTELSGIALIQFDGGEIIATNQIDPHDPSKGTDPALEARNTIDADTPTSTITTAPGTQSRRAINLSLQGTDLGAGIASYDIYVSDNGAPFQLALANVVGNAATWRGESGHTYAFYSVARDGVGLLEDAPAIADTTITLAPAEEIVLNKQRPKFIFTDEDGTKVTVTWSGLGTATLHRGVDAATGRGDLLDIDITGSTATSRLTITPTKGDTTLDTLEVHSALAALNLKGVHLLDHATISAPVPTITFGNLLNGADVTLSGVLAKGGVKFIAGDISGESDLTSASPLSTLQAIRWTDGAISAPAIGTLSITGSKKPVVAGDFGADLTLTNGALKWTLNSAKVAGVISGLWNVAGNANSLTGGSTAASWDASFTGNVNLLKTARDFSGAFAANAIKTLTVGGNLTDAQVTVSQNVVPAKATLTALGSLTVAGSLNHAEIFSAGHIGSITAGAITGSRILAGVNAGIVGMPDGLDDFNAAAKIGNVNIKGLKGVANAVSDSEIAARSLGKIVLRNILTDNADTEFGLAADKIASLVIYQGRTIQKRLTNVDAAGSDFTLDDFSVRVI